MTEYTTQITIVIEVDNQAFVDNFNLETRLVLEEAWEKIRQQGITDNSTIYLHDSNGNNGIRHDTI